MFPPTGPVRDSAIARALGLDGLDGLLVRSISINLFDDSEVHVGVSFILADDAKAELAEILKDYALVLRPTVPGSGEDGEGI